MSWEWWLILVVPATWSEAGLGKSVRPYLKNKLKSKRSGVVSQVVVYLTSKWKPPSSILINTTPSLEKPWILILRKWSRAAGHGGSGISKNSLTLTLLCVCGQQSLQNPDCSASSAPFGPHAFSKPCSLALLVFPEPAHKYSAPKFHFYSCQLFMLLTRSTDGHIKRCPPTSTLTSHFLLPVTSQNHHSP
jgi:hypothetical protein